MTTTAPDLLNKKQSPRRTRVKINSRIRFYLLFGGTGLLAFLLLFAAIFRIFFHQSIPNDIDPMVVSAEEARLQFGRERQFLYQEFVAADFSMDRLSPQTNNLGLQGLVEVMAGEISMEIDEMIKDPGQYPEYQGRTRRFIIAAEQQKVAKEMYRLQFNAEVDARLCMQFCQRFSPAENYLRLGLRFAALDLLLSVRSPDPKTATEIARGQLTNLSHYLQGRNTWLAAEEGQAGVDYLNQKWREALDEINASRGAQ